MDINSRKKELEDLDVFIKSKQEALNSILDSLGWSEESLKNEAKVCCPLNSGHWIPERSLLHHKEICECAEDGYLKNDLDKQPPDSSFFYEKSRNVVPVKLDQFKLKKILLESGLLKEDNAATVDIPKTFDRWIVQFNPEQRLAIYDYIINASKTAEKPKNVTLEDLMIDFEKKEDQDDKPKSQLEILAEMRDYKRRRQSYRAKNVHITKKSYTEVMKEVIENQTNYLMETSKIENSENSRSESENSHTKRKYSHDTDNYSNPEDSFKNRDHHSSSKDKRHHSHYESPKHHSSKRKKHKKDRSRSRSPSHHKHKKSHKRKRSHD